MVRAFIVSCGAEFPDSSVVQLILRVERQGGKLSVTEVVEGAESLVLDLVGARLELDGPSDGSGRVIATNGHGEIATLRNLKEVPATSASP